MANPYIIERRVTGGRIDAATLAPPQYLKIVNGEDGLVDFWTDIREKADMFTQIEAFTIRCAMLEYYDTVRAVPL